MLLAVAVDAAHALLKARRVPRHVVIDHEPAELEVDAFGGGVGAEHESRAAVIGGLSEAFDLFLPLRVVHAAMDLGDLPGVAHAAKALDQEAERVAVLGEDDVLLAGELRIGENLPQLVEFGFGSVIVDRLRQFSEGDNLFPFGDQVAQRGRDHAGQQVLFGCFVLFPAVLRGLVVGGLAVQNILFLGQPALERDQLLHRQPSVLDLADQVVELLDAALK